MADNPTLIQAKPARDVGPLRLTAAIVARLEEFAAEGYPHEACGLLLGRSAPAGVDIVDVTAARNLEPARRHDRYVLDPLDWLAAEEHARDRGVDVVGVWHTHPDHPARPSSTDLEAAWPHFTYLILSVRADGVADVTAWRLAEAGADSRARFVEQSVEEVAP